MKFFVLLFLSGMLMMSCKPKSGKSDVTSMPANATVNDYETEIMKIHDNVMPNMTELNNLETQLRNIRTKAGQSDQGSSAIPQGIDDMIAAVKGAQNGMLDWMEYYSAMRAKLQPDVMLAFMKQELVTINQVKDNMNSTIEKAKAWLAAHPNI